MSILIATLTLGFGDIGPTAYIILLRQIMLSRWIPWGPARSDGPLGEKLAVGQQRPSGVGYEKKGAQEREDKRGSSFWFPGLCSL